MKLGLREWICVAVLAAMPLGAWSLYFRPRGADRERVLSDFQAQQSRLLVLRQAAASVGEVEESAAGLTKAVDSLRAKLPHAGEIDKVVKEIWELAESNRLGLKNIQTTGGEEKALEGDPYPTQMVSFQIEGDFAGFYSFLLAMENQPRIIRVQKLGVRTLDNVGEGHVQASLMMKVFYEPGAS